MTNRILMTADPLGGVFTITLDLAKALGEYGIEILIAVMGSPMNEDQKSTASKIPNLTVIEKSYKLEWMENPWKDVEQAGTWLLDLEQAFQPDLIHLNTYVHAALPWHAPKLVVAHSCALSWWEAVKREPITNDWLPYQKAVRHGLQCADWIVAPSKTMLLSLVRHYGPLGQNMTVVYNGRDAGPYAGAEKQKLILCAGRVWDEAKNVDLLIQAAPSLHWPIAVAGDSRRSDGQLNGFPNVCFLGQIPPEELASWYARASIYVHPALHEPFGLSVLEAALCGCALVLGDIPSLREVWGEAALYVPPRNPQALQSILRDLMANTQLREEMALRSQARASYFSTYKMARGYKRLYEKLDGVRPGPNCNGRDELCAF